jgi:nucleotide-binding universal stress UspA family protein
MGLERIVAAADESEAGRQGVKAALAWAGPLGATVTLFHVLPRVPAAALRGGAGNRGAGADSLAALETWVTAEVAEGPGQRPPAIESGYGLPGIEIPRYAELAGARLLVLGRKPRSMAQRLYEGDTADAVARRSTVPCLFVRRPLRIPARMLVAVDGTDRGMRVLQIGSDIATRLGCRLSGVIVERLHPGEPPGLAGVVPTARTAALQRRLNGAIEPLLVRQGDPSTEILKAAHDLSAEVIIIGYRRGGPPGLIEAGSVARQVAHHAPCAVLTVPL